MTLGIIVGCKTTEKNDNRPTCEIYREAVKMYEDEDYVEAAKLLEVVMKNPSSICADSALYYLAEIDFEEGDFIYSAFHYNRLRRQYPSSSFVKKSLYKSALCNYELSLPYDRDQEYTRKAITSFQEYQMLYSEQDSLYKEASKKIDELRNKLARREYSVGDLYLTMDNPTAAIIYFDSVIDLYSDTDFYEDAYMGKIQSLVQLRKYDEALGIISLYSQKFPNGQYYSELAEIKQNIEQGNYEPY